MNYKILNNLYEKGIIYFPKIIQNCYKEILIDYNRYKTAKTTKNKSIGGADKESTLEHFEQRFLNSASRTEYLILKPSKIFQNIKHDLLSTLLYGNIGVLDIACGTGGGTFNLFCTIAELIESNKLCSLPVTLNIYAADYSMTALEIYEKFIKKIIPFLKEKGIEINYKTYRWNAFCPINTAELMDLFTEKKYDENLIMISNFSGALKKSDTDPILNNLCIGLLSRLHNRNFLFIWIEPIMKSSKNLFNRIYNIFKHILPNFFEKNTSDELHDYYKWKDFIKQNIVKGSIRLKEYKRG